MLTLEAVNQQLDDLLERIGEKLQLSPTRYQQAENRYQTIGEWLSAKGSPLAIFKPTIYPQGSMRIGTTVKPRGRQEHDLDLVLELAADWRLFPQPVVLLDMVENRLRENETYHGMIKRKNRCIRIIYANEFHLDILPACPNPAAGLYCVVVPDCAAEDWKHSNPKGYALWFEMTAERKQAEFRKHMEPLPEQATVAELAPLQRAVQLLKRYRDVYFEEMLDLAPVSIVLTTLAAQHYSGHQSVSSALMGILNGIVSSIPTYGRLYVLNPTNPLEDFSERWESEPKAYQAFVTAIADFRDQWARAGSLVGIHQVSGLMEKLFGENLTKEVVAEHIKSLESARKAGNLSINRGTGIITSTSSASSTSIPNNNFYGG